MTALLQGFDEYMNLVLDEAEEISVKRKTRKAVGEHDARHRMFGQCFLHKSSDS